MSDSHDTPKASTDDAKAQQKDDVLKLTFDLHPSRTLHISVHENVINPSELSARALSYGNTNIGGDDNDHGKADDGCGRFAIMDAKRITSLTHLAVAGNAALLRSERNKSIESGGKRKRGIALDTIICAGGSSNVGNVLRDFTFIQSQKMQQGEGGGNGANNRENVIQKRQKNEKLTTPAMTKAVAILAMGYDCLNDGEYESFLSDIGLTDSAPSEQGSVNMTAISKKIPIVEYFQRDRTEEESKDILRVFKLTKEEINMDQGENSPLDMAVVNRVATKFIV